MASLSCAKICMRKTGTALLSHLPSRHCPLVVGAVSRGLTPNRGFSTSERRAEEKKYKLLVLGGGSGGSSVAATFSDLLGKGEVAVLDPATVHYYQPMWTLVGAGLKDFKQTEKPMEWVMPKNCDWLIDSVSKIEPEKKSVVTAKGDTIKYDFMVVSIGLQLRFDLVKGLTEALENDPRVCSNYSPKYVKKTFPALENFKGGDAIFTFPNTPIKCAGAPQKIAYLFDDYMRREGKRDTANIVYNTSLPAIFGIPRYASVLKQLCENRNITVNTRHNMVSIDHNKSEAVFELLDEPGKTVSFKYDFLHAGAPCSSNPVLAPIGDAGNWVDVNRGSLQHVKYDNIFAIGDCTNAPTAKTAASAITQAGLVCRNLNLVMSGEPIGELREYDGYTSCPLVTSKDKCILAEFGYDGNILETFPYDQRKESYISGFMKKHIMPILYFHGGVRGRWSGPRPLRKLFSPFKSY